MHYDVRLRTLWIKYRRRMPFLRNKEQGGAFGIARIEYLLRKIKLSLSSRAHGRQRHRGRFKWMDRSRRDVARRRSLARGCQSGDRSGRLHIVQTKAQSGLVAVLSDHRSIIVTCSTIDA